MEFLHLAGGVSIVGILGVIGFDLWCRRSDLCLWLGWKRLAWPYFDCEQCVGQTPGTGCYCANSDAVAPCKPPERWRYGLRKALKFLGVDSL